MVDCDPERIMWLLTHVNEIKLYSSFKRTSDYRSYSYFTFKGKKPISDKKNS